MYIVQFIIFSLICNHIISFVNKNELKFIMKQLKKNFLYVYFKISVDYEVLAIET